MEPEDKDIPYSEIADILLKSGKVEEKKAENGN